MYLCFLFVLLLVFPVRCIDLGDPESTLTLNLSNQGLTEVPQGIGLMTKLKELYLGNNSLVEIPDEIGNLVDLEKLYVEGNNLLSLPSSIGNLKKLIELNGMANQLESLPNQIGFLTELTWVCLIDNKLSSVPTELGNLKNLDHINLAFNELVSLPSELSKLEKLDWARFDYNKLTEFPRQITNLPITWLYLDFNEIPQIPREVENLSKVKFLKLDNNLITNVPKEFKSLLALTSLNLATNKLRGELDLNTFLPPNLQVLDLSENRFDSIKYTNNNDNVSPLKELDLHDNIITKFEQMSSFPNIQVLDLSRNRDLGTIPTDIFSMSKLSTLSLGFTEISKLPDEIKTLKNLENLHIQGNGLTRLPLNLNASKLEKLSLKENPWICDCRMERWFRQIKSLVIDEDYSKCADVNQHGGTPLHRLSFQSNEPCTHVKGLSGGTFADGKSSESLDLLWSFNDPRVDPITKEIDYFDCVGVVDECVDESTCDETIECKEILFQNEITGNKENEWDCYNLPPWLQQQETDCTIPKHRPMLAFEIRYAPAKLNLPIKSQQKICVWDMKNVQLTQLEKFTSYEITVRPLFVRAVSDLSYDPYDPFGKDRCQNVGIDTAAGPRSNPIFLTTRQDIPTSPPVNITVSVAKESEAFITWQKPIESNGIIAEYKLHIVGPNGTLVEMKSDVANVIVGSLVPGNLYIVSIQASTNANRSAFGPFSTPVSFSTQQVCADGFERKEFPVYDCYACKDGFSSTAGSGCQPCPVNHFKDELICKPCARGYFSSAGASKCEPCPLNQFFSDEKETCLKCPDERPVTIGVGTRSQEGCVANIGSFLDGDKVVDCTKQEVLFRGVDCFANKGLTLETLTLKKGFWRLTNKSTSIFQCDSGHCEQTSKRKEDPYCTEFRMGILCKQCIPEYSETDGICTPCDPEETNHDKALYIFWIFFFTFVLISPSLVIFCLARRKRVIKGSNNNSNENDAENQLDRENDDNWHTSCWPYLREIRHKIGTKFRILLGFAQVLFFFVEVVEFFPTGNAFRAFNGLVNIDLLQFLSGMFNLGCFSNITNHGTLLVAYTLSPVACFVAIGMMLTLLWFKYPMKALDYAKSKSAAFILIILVIIYPGISNAILRSFMYTEFERFDDDPEPIVVLSHDYSVKFEDYRPQRIYAGFMIIVYIIGIYALIFWCSKKQFQYATFLFRAYVDKYSWFECHELLRKLILTSVFALIHGSIKGQGDAAFPFIVIVLIYLQLLQHWNPYAHVGDQYFAQWSLFSLLVIAIFHTVEYNYQANKLFFTIIVCIEIILFIFISYMEIQTLKNNPPQKKVELSSRSTTPSAASVVSRAGSIPTPTFPQFATIVVDENEILFDESASAGKARRKLDPDDQPKAKRKSKHHS